MITSDDEVLGERALLAALVESATADSMGQSQRLRANAMRWLESDVGLKLMILMSLEPDAVFARIREVQAQNPLGLEDVA